MSQETTGLRAFQELVLEVVKGQQQQLDRLTSELNGNERAGLKEIAVETRGRLERLEQSVAESLRRFEHHENRLDSNEKEHGELRTRVNTLIEREQAHEKAEHEKTLEAKETKKRKIDWFAELARAAVIMAVVFALKEFFGVEVSG